MFNQEELGQNNEIFSGEERLRLVSAVKNAENMENVIRFNDDKF